VCLTENSKTYTMVSPIVRDVLETFSHAYTNDTEYIVSCMLANSGVYNLVYKISPIEIYNRNKYSFAKIHNSYIWNDLGIISDVLRKSFLYNSTINAYSMICIMDDTALSVQLKTFKASLVEVVKKHAVFLSYCDMEGSELFTFCNANQAIPKDIYTVHCKEVKKDFQSIFKRFSKFLPKCVMDILDVILFWVDVRHHTDGYMVEPCDMYKAFPCPPRYNENIFHTAMADLVYCKVDTLSSTIYKLYKHAIPFYVLNQLEQLFTLHGEKLDEHPPLKVFYNKEAMDGLITLKAFVHEDTNNLMPMMKNIFVTPFWKQAFDTLEDTHLLELYTPAFMGTAILNAFKDIQETYLKNHKIMVLGDILSCGIFSALSKSHQLDPCLIEPLITKCTHSVKAAKSQVLQNVEILNIVEHALKPLMDALKRVRRYWLYCCKLFDIEDAPNYLDLIFGDVFDMDGTPSTCAICLDTSQERKDTWFALTCKHVFHIECINNMCAFSANCPCCRSEI
jgi:sulfur relay (sulfurtransferase) DsrF/TusC family protein